MFRYIELSLAGGLFLGFLLSIQQILWGQTLLLISGLSLSVLYAYLAFNGTKSRPEQSSVFITIFSFLISAIAMIALSLKLTLSPDVHYYYRMALFGLMGGIVLLLINLYMAQTESVFAYYRGLLIRNLIVISIGFMFYITPYRKLVGLYYKNQPEVAKALIQKLEPPKPEPKKEDKK